MSAEDNLEPEAINSFDTADLGASLQSKEHSFDHETDEIKNERDSSIDTADLGAEQQESSQSQAFNPETGEINWDCPCLGGMAHGTCGEEFKSAFSCFVYSEEEPKGMDCVGVFKSMQECFRAHPEEYASELEDDEDEEKSDDKESGDEELGSDVVGFVEEKSDSESDEEKSDNETDIEDITDADQKPRDGEPQN
ncbi:Oxidoreductase [Coemansia sp. RSA 1822]|nr:Oxidoreductase [Coemansia sp. RSA 638]KAJ2539095.1 Oxidoreductase [Coemansia sp. RSA 1853]KAJ2566867.1 Oxidoreductase [Coemansia sp. RSA 1822]